MADSGLRRLERIAQSSGSPDAWAAYISAATRAGEFDPLNWDEAISYLTKTPIPTKPNYQTLIEEGYGESYQQQLDQYYQEQETWAENEVPIIDILHQIRIANGHWGAQRIANHISSVFPRIFKGDFTATIETAETRRLLDNGQITEGVLIPSLEGPEEVNTDVISIPQLEIFVSFDEKLFMPGRRIREETQPAIPRPINDFTTQVYVVSHYTYWTEAHGEQMSEVVEFARYSDPHQLMLTLIHMRQLQTAAALGDIYHEREIAEMDRLWEEGDF